MNACCGALPLFKRGKEAPPPSFEIYNNPPLLKEQVGGPPPPRESNILGGSPFNKGGLKGGGFPPFRPGIFGGFPPSPQFFFAGGPPCPPIPPYVAQLGGFSLWFFGGFPPPWGFKPRFFHKTVSQN